MTELSFLLDILLNHTLTKPTKEAIRERIRIVEAGLTPQPKAPAPPPPPPNPRAQAPSTMALLAKHPDLDIPGAEAGVPAAALIPAPEPVAVIAQTPAAAQALAQRNEAIQRALSGKREPGRTSPRKF